MALVELSGPSPHSQDAVECAFCLANLDSLSVQQRQIHYEGHFDSDAETISARDNDLPQSSLSAKANASSSSVIYKAKSILPCLRETNDFWYPAHTNTPPPSHTPALISLIHRGLCKGHDRGNVRRAVLCYDQVVHISRETWDIHWGCGYRNFLMACGALMNQKQQPLYFPLLDWPISPSIRNLQAWIEAAWKEGFDKEGSKELKKLINTSKWIGTADLWVAFVFRGIPAELVDFDLRNHREGIDLMIKWIVNYFTPNQTIDKPTNIFESLTNSPVTSYEVDAHGITNLLTFDPAYRPFPELRSKALTEFYESRSLDSHVSPREDSTATTSSGPSYLKRKRSKDVPFLQKEKSPKIREADYPKPSSKETSTNTTRPSNQGPSKNTSKNDLDLYSVLKKFRLDPKRLSHRKQYQILYFPMTAPLTDREKMQRKEVTSTRIS